MKKIFTPLFLFFLVHHVSACGSFYGQLVDFNYNWEKYADRAPTGEARDFMTDGDLVAAHLGSVLPILRSNPVEHLSIAQLRNRYHLIEVLDGYREAGQFPINYYHQERIPVFIDEHNTHCAVGYLLQQSGYEHLAQRMARQDNYIWVKDIQDPDVFAWQKASGFSLEELKLIQGAYDNYIVGALYLPNRYEIPQKPEHMTVYFENDLTLTKDSTEANIWCHGEGKNGVLHGRWEQNFAKGVPWIEGYFNMGKRTGQWKEYYQGTDKLCRTENWRNDKLNGVRKRFDRQGNLIEEINFRDGKAISKTNYAADHSMIWIRKPLDSNKVYTEIYTGGGGFLAAGHELIHNPGNLLWFQNIELTALNSMAITSKTMGSSNSMTYGGGGYNYGALNSNDGFTTTTGLFETPPLVTYIKVGAWKYYKEHNTELPTEELISLKTSLHQSYPHFASELFRNLRVYYDSRFHAGFDSLVVMYENNLLIDFYGYGDGDFAHFQVEYHPVIPRIYFPYHGRPRHSRFQNEFVEERVVKSKRQYDQEGEKIGVWKYFDKKGMLESSEDFTAMKQEELKKAWQKAERQKNTERKDVYWGFGPGVLRAMEDY